MSSPIERFRDVLQAGDRTNRLYDLAVALRDEGRSQVEILDLFDRFRAEHQEDKDEAVYNSILDVMDCLVGHCSPAARIFNGPP